MTDAQLLRQEAAVKRAMAQFTQDSAVADALRREANQLDGIAEKLEQTEES